MAHLGALKHRAAADFQIWRTRRSLAKYTTAVEAIRCLLLSVSYFVGNAAFAVGSVVEL